MRTIMVLNPKGGSGKSTISMNLATYYADEGQRVTLADYDPQGSCLDWLEARRDYTGIPEIRGVAAWQAKPRIPANSDYVIMDVPARTHGHELANLLAHAQSVIMPVLPSPIDMRAAVRYVEELGKTAAISKDKTRMALVANRVRERTVIAHDLDAFLHKLGVPLVATLRESQNYVRAAQTGLGIFELAPSAAQADVDQWVPLLTWLDSAASRPKH
ncbi:MAG: ParA family protein [Chromatiales bacterium]|nr:ParA family protein [Chromatiales bacterium]